MNRMMKAAVAAFQTYKTGLRLGLFPRALRIEHKGQAAYGQGDVIDPESGQIEFQDYLIAGFIHVHQGPVFMFVMDVTKFERMQQTADLSDVTTENFLMERLFA